MGWIVQKLLQRLRIVEVQVSLSPIERAASAIHDALKKGADIEDTLARYEELMRKHPDAAGDVLSQRAYSWAWVGKSSEAVEDLQRAIVNRTGGRLAADLAHLAGRLMELHRFSDAQQVWARLIEVEHAEQSNYFVEHAMLLRSYALASIGRGAEALSLLAGVAEDASWDGTENLPEVTPALIRSLTKRVRGERGSRS
jgi:tetratricopeptide (TPR) repeat protein